MGWNQQIIYEELKPALPAPVKKQIWDQETQTFIPTTLYKRMGLPKPGQLEWLRKTYGHEGVYKKGQFWEFSMAGNYIVMDEKIYMWFQMKWGNR